MFLDIERSLNGKFGEIDETIDRLDTFSKLHHNKPMSKSNVDDIDAAADVSRKYRVFRFKTKSYIIGTFH